MREQVTAVAQHEHGTAAALQEQVAQATDKEPGPGIGRAANWILVVVHIQLETGVALVGTEEPSSTPT